MAKDVEIDEPLIEFFRNANINAVHQVIERARRNASMAAQGSAAVAKASCRPGLLARCMNTAMTAYGRSAKGRASIRQTAPDTGGRPYHFAYSTISKGERGQPSQRGAKKGGAAGAGEAAAASSRRSAAGKPARNREATHQIYLGRAAALEKGASLEDCLAIETRLQEQRDEQAMGPSQDLDREPGLAAGPGRDSGRQAGSRARDAGLAQAWVEAGLGEVPGLSGVATERAAQSYIEDPSKAAAALMGTTASFGTIGETLQERLAFWDLVHEHESGKGGRTQIRLVLELPHEATAQERHSISQRHTDEFRRRGLPFWASIHAPTAANDSRNHHAHVVLADRPMRRMPHPDTGAMAWDLTIRDDYRTATRHTRVRYPHRQKRDPEMRDRGYVRASRERFAAVVNEVMAGSASGASYDPRSYKDMGLDVAPMRNVARILADKLGRRSFVVMDADWTRKMIDTEMQAAAARCDRTFLDLQEADRRMQDTARQAQRSAAANARLPTHLRLTPGRVIARKASEAVMTKLLDLRRDRLAARFADETTLQALQHVAAATAPQPGRGRPGRVHDTATAPDPADLAALHEATTEEIAHLARASRAKQAGMARREAELARSWREGPQAPAASGLVGLQPRRIADAGRSPVSAPPVKAAPSRWNQWLSPMSAKTPWTTAVRAQADDDGPAGDPGRRSQPTAQSVQTSAPAYVPGQAFTWLRQSLAALAEATDRDAHAFVDGLNAMREGMIAAARDRREPETATAAQAIRGPEQPAPGRPADGTPDTSAGSSVKSMAQRSEDRKKQAASAEAAQTAEESRKTLAERPEAARSAAPENATGQPTRPQQAAAAALPRATRHKTPPLPPLIYCGPQLMAAETKQEAQERGGRASKPAAPPAAASGAANDATAKAEPPLARQAAPREPSAASTKAVAAGQSANKQASRRAATEPAGPHAEPGGQPAPTGLKPSEQAKKKETETTPIPPAAPERTAEELEEARVEALRRKRRKAILAARRGGPGL